MKNALYDRRIDIDLLRATAVLSVILYHFDFSGISGGFFGVDMFFVISGYLITSHIHKQISNSCFSFSLFYLKRIRRLFPALITTTLLCSIGAIYFLPKPLFIDYSLSQLSSSLYLSNIYFWSISSYFDTNATFKPLLHTWSLSVEEQFYLFWPIFLFIAYRRFTLIIICILLVSLLGSEYLYGKSPATVFYLFPFRIFEFSIGALAHKITSDNLSSAKKNYLLLIGVLSILITFISANEYSKAPGFISLPICIATAAIIYIKHPLINTYNIITAPLLRIGRVSYSAYLVHWPVVVFFKSEYPGQLDYSDSFLLLLITYLLAEIIYYFIEKPALKINLRKNAGKLIALSMGIIAYSILYMLFSNNIYGYFHPETNSIKYDG
jgi:peptidoglycan/LPS O-acetylase OafA/YrhL